MNTQYEIYIDSDGVIADFDAYVIEKFGKSVSEFESKNKFWSKLGWFNNNVEPFFSNLPKMAHADELIKLLTEKFHHVKILTATGHVPKNVGEQKTEWYAKHYPYLEVILVRKSSEKAKYAHSGAILIDDRDKSIVPWVEAGGIGCLFESMESVTNLLKTLEI